jgi:Immunity protein 52
MSGEVNHVKAYWGPREETTHDCAVRLARMLEELAEAHPAFSHWNKQAYSRAAANKPAWAMPPDIDELTKVFEKGRQFKDRPRIPWPEMGYRVPAWNGLDPPYGASLSVGPGTYTASRSFPNTIDLGLNRAGPDNTDLINVAVLKPALRSVAMAWEPDYAVVVPWAYWPQAFGGDGYPQLRSGWMTYLAPQYADQIIPPPAAIVEPMPNGRILLLATEEPFDMENPAHLAVAVAVQTALSPLQEMIPFTPHELSGLRLRQERRDKGRPA